VRYCHKCTQCSCQRAVNILFKFQLNWNSLDRFSKNPEIYLMKIRPVGGESFYAEGRTDRQI